ncbi:invasion associated locus B family protein [Rhizobium sp. SL86]|uniref:invasion associated locus B family protein n=1 Tax=Rhizobium sp. SL86 TaxID=2995148 RepID=UPI0022766933|nr:invasion associated locus B family protein [Rhizobium sp. SL86]MCY1665489.1 invasion associated locus B family protein [Rhizobium sp. SL86]
MPRIKKSFVSLPVLLLAAISASLVPASFVPAAQLPGGKGSLVEPHGDWAVVCRGQNGLVGCVLSQVQADPVTGRPMLSAEFRPLPQGRLEGALLLPFGMALAAGVVLSADGLPQPLRFAYSTCLPGGCVVPIRLDTPAVSVLQAVQTFSLTTVQLSTGEEVPMRVSLSGFSAALQRATELSK